MEPARPNFQLAGAGGTLLGTTVAFIAVGALVGWAAGSVGIGILVGAFLGIPAGILAVYRRYRSAF
jgi:F0F1-type ATP synthase assembly protein I